MSEERYLTGQVARMFNISPDAVRYYNKVGLLGPPRAGNNYRHFDLHQLSTLQSVLMLRRFGLSIDAIKEFVDAVDVSRVADSLESVRTQTQDQIRELTAIALRLDRFSQQVREVEQFGTEVCFRPSPRWWSLSVHHEFDLGELIAALNRVECGIESDPSCAFFMKRDSLERGEFTYSNCGILLQQPCAVGGYALEELPSRPCAYLTYAGPKNTGSSDGAHAYRRVLSWIAEAGYAVAGDAIERFIISNHVGYLLEIWVPISREE